MKKTITVFALFACILSAGAQEKVKEVVTDSYDRNGLSVIVVTRGDNYDYQSVNFANKLAIDEKFDANLIGTKTIQLRKDRSIPITQSEADSLIKCSGVSKEILGYIYNRKEDGSMNDELLRYRGQYNATDQDVINSAAAKVNEQHLEWGEKLVGSSYIVLLDFVNIHQLEDKNGKKMDGYVLDAYAFAYKVDCPREKLDEFYMSSWVEVNDTPAKKEAAIKAFNDMELNALPVASVKSSSSNLASSMAGIGSSFKDAGAAFKDLGASFKAAKTTETAEKPEQKVEVAVAPTFAEHSVEAAENDAYFGAITKLENKITEWQVAVSIISTKPLKAKIGKKEGLSNGKRFRAYSYTEDKEGNLVSKKRGYLRATKVSDNRSISSGSTEPSEFYQISGVANIKDGWTIKQKNDIKLGVALTGKYGGFSNIGANVDLDYLIHISKVGSFYGLLNVGTDVLAYGQSIQGHKFMNLNFGAGVGYGLHAGRFVEIMPYAIIGADYMKLNDENLKFDGLTDEENKKTTALFVEPGLRVAFQVAYPFSIFVKGGYDVLLNKDDNRTHYNCINMSIDENRKHKSGVFGEVGFRLAF